MQIQGQVSLANTATTVLTVGLSQAVEIFSIELHSVSPSSQNIEVYFVKQSGGNVGTAGLSNRKEAFTLPANGSLALVAPKAPWKYTSQNDTIQIKTNTAAALNYNITVAVNGVL